MEQALLVFTNVPDAELARTLATELLKQQLAACVNILPTVQSIYRWQGAIEEAAEVSLIIKTTQARYAELQEAIVRLHPYDVPEIIALPLQAGLPAYLRWIELETTKEMNA